MIEQKSNSEIVDWRVLVQQARNAAARQAREAFERAQEPNSPRRLATLIADAQRCEMVADTLHGLLSAGYGVHGAIERGSMVPMEHWHGNGAGMPNAAERAGQERTSYPPLDPRGGDDG